MTRGLAIIRIEPRHDSWRIAVDDQKGHVGDVTAAE